MPTVVAPEHDDGVVGILALGQRIKQHTEAVIHIADIRQIGALRLFVHLGFVGQQKARVRSKKLFAVFIDNVIEIVAHNLDRFNFIERIQVEKLLRNLPRQVRFGDAQRQEKRLAGKIALELIGRPFAGEIIFGLFDRCLAGAPGEIGASGFDALRRRGCFLPQHAFVGAARIGELLKRPLALIHAGRRRVLVEDLASGERVIAVLAEIFRQGDDILGLGRVLKILSVAVDAGRSGPFAGQQRRAGGTTNR